VSNGQYYGGYRAQPRDYPTSPARSSPQPQAPLKARVVRNAVNLRKRSLRLVEAGPGEFVLEFAFDASKPCAVSVFWGGSEAVRGAEKHSVTCGHQPCGGRTRFPGELGCEFPPEGLSDSEKVRLGGLRLGLHEEAALVAPKSEGGSKRWPLIIRLECVDAPREGVSLDDLPPGGSMPAWVQSQTNYCVLEKLGEGEEGFRVKLEKQVIWKQGMAYELLEIFGLESASSGQVEGIPADAGAGGGDAASPADGLDAGNECVICLSEPRDTTVLPCRHLCMCSGCANELRNQPQTNKCPICRTPVSQLLEIKLKSSRDQDSSARRGGV